jgi:hypothetical protein
MDVERNWKRSRVALGAALAFGLAALGGAACEDNENSRSAACRVFCEELEKCDDTTDLAQCADTCRAQTYRSDLYLETRASCAEMSCNHWASQVTSDGQDDCTTGQCALVDCIGDKLDKVDLSSADAQRCEAATNKLLGCDTSLDEDAVRSDCALLLLSASGEYAQKSRDCVDEPCVEIGRCLDKLSDEYDTTLRIFGGTLSF